MEPDLTQRRRDAKTQPKINEAKLWPDLLHALKLHDLPIDYEGEEIPGEEDEDEDEDEEDGRISSASLSRFTFHASPPL